jgi:hypothetical protein
VGGRKKRRGEFFARPMRHWASRRQAADGVDIGVAGNIW